MKASSTDNSNKEPLYWSRNLIKDERETLLPVIQSANIISISDPDDPTNDLLHRAPLPDGAQLLQIGTSLQDFDIPQLLAAGANTVFVSHAQARPVLAHLLDALPTLCWIQSRNAGIDSILSSTVTDAYSAGRIIMTNAKGQFSSSLAEHALAACSYFAKDYPRLRRNQQAKQWDQYVLTTPVKLHK
jgi:phosphoglycerate dehydrogenase-like enzyme